MRNKFFVCVVLLVLFAVMFSGCKGREIRRPVPAQMPEWCLKTSGAVLDAKRGKLVIGIGRIDNIKSVEMARANVDGKSRLEVATILNEYVQLILNEYVEYVDANGVKTSEQEVLDGAKAFSDINLRASIIEDRYVDEAGNIWYSKAVSSVSNFDRNLQLNAELSERIKSFIDLKGDEFFAKLSQHN